jgi:hypothetical protein
MMRGLIERPSRKSLNFGNLLADGDCDGTPCRYRPGILVNFYGTFITAGELPVDDQKYAEGYINSDDEWGYTEGGSITFAKMMEREKGAQ